MNVKRELMLAKLRQRKAELEQAMDEQRPPEVEPIFVAHPEAWFGYYGRSE